MVYRERRSTVVDAIVWHRVTDAGETWVLPDGCMDIIWDGTELVVAGPDTGPHVALSPAPTLLCALRFAPGTGPAVLGVAADAVRDERVPLGALWSSVEVARVEERLRTTDEPAAVLERVAATRLAANPPDPIAVAVADLLDDGRTVAEVADAVGLSDRQLHRRSVAAFGYGPKVLARILRLQRALALARGGAAFAAAAAEAGYADQAHLAREVRALAGAPLGELT